MGERLPAAEVRPVAEELVARFTPHCKQIQIAGSLRREKSTVKDIEIVAEPQPHVDLFGNEVAGRTHLDAELERMLAEGEVVRRARDDGQRLAWGERFKAFIYKKVPVDLFMVHPPAQWGAVFAIRTGPGDFSKQLVTECQKRGVRCVQGALHRADGSIIYTPTEEVFFRECGVRWKPPQDR